VTSLKKKVMPVHARKEILGVADPARPYKEVWQGGIIIKMATLYSGISSVENAPLPKRQSGNTI